MATSGKLKFTRFSGVSHYEVGENCAATIEYFANDKKFFIFEIEGLTVVEEPDEGMIYGGPVLFLIFHGVDLSWDSLVPGLKINVPVGGYDEQFGDHLAHCTFEDSEDLDDNKIEILKVEPERILISWTGTTHDPIFYDHSKPRATLECETWMSIVRSKQGPE